MSHQVRFKKEINVLLGKRTHWLTTTLFSKTLGRPPALNQKILKGHIKKLQNIATEALSKSLAKREFEKCVPHKKRWSVRGHGNPKKKLAFLVWFGKHFPLTKRYVYIFWGKGNHCLYIGRSGKQNQRPSNHFHTDWFSKTVRIEIFTTNSYKDLPKLECLGHHYFKPTYNKIKPSESKWTSSCPLCDMHKSIETELKSIFGK
jgi:hypothetical protein